LIWKRIFDVAISLFALFLLAPLLVFIAFAVRIGMGAPVIFRQWRAGRDGALFQMLKFRTMTETSSPDGRPLPDAERLARLGKLLRSTSLDELPELWNVLKGDMSLVGPRPLLPEYLPRYTPTQRRRHEVKPGITGWAQVNGRNGLAWDEKFKLDIWYVDHGSLWLDVRILWMTMHKVVRGEGISQQGHATMPEFAGNSSQPRRDG
jgi:lipopolysaccharide/colanic/teichoic acid biosynthesis glycosyltransferase